MAQFRVTVFHLAVLELSDNSDTSTVWMGQAWELMFVSLSSTLQSLGLLVACEVVWGLKVRAVNLEGLLRLR